MYWQKIDSFLIRFARDLTWPMFHVALGVVYVWFGLLKVVGVSPAEQLVVATQAILLPFLPAAAFVVALGVWETIIGLLLLSGRLHRLAIGMLVVQLPATFAPLVLVPERTWQVFPLALTTDGQYIVKNLLIIALAIAITARLSEVPDPRAGFLKILTSD